MIGPVDGVERYAKGVQKIDKDGPPRQKNHASMHSLKDCLLSC